MWGNQRRTRVSTALVLGVALVVWNVVFDRGISDAAHRYLALQQQRGDGVGPVVRVQDIMRPAAVESARRATAWTGLILIAGMLAVAWVSRPPRRAKT
jgi:hypothetical protein